MGAFRERAKSWRSWRHHSCKIGDDAVPFAGLGLDRRNELAVTVLVFVPKGPCRSVLGGRAEKEEEKCEGAESEQGEPRRAQAGPPDGVERPEDRLSDNHDPGGITGQDPVRVVLATDEREAREVVPVKGHRARDGMSAAGRDGRPRRLFDFAQGYQSSTLISRSEAPRPSR